MTDNMGLFENLQNININEFFLVNFRRKCGLEVYSLLLLCYSLQQLVLSFIFWQCKLFSYCIFLNLSTNLYLRFGKRWTVAIPRTVFVAIAMANQAIQSMGGSAKILTKNKANEIFHSDWVVRDRRFAAATGFAPRFDLGAGFGNTISWYRTQRWL